MMIMSELDMFVSLSERVNIYVPSTSNVNHYTDTSSIIKDVASELSGLFGGATAQEVSGYWLSDKIGLVAEKIVIVYSNCSKEGLTNNISKVVAICENIKTKLAQECVSLEVNGTLYFI